MSKPILQAMVLADHVYQDRSTGKYIIAGTFSRVNMVPPLVEQKQEDGPASNQPKKMTGSITRAGSPYLYLGLVEVHGKISLKLKFVDLSDGDVLFVMNFEVASVDPLALGEYSVPVPMLPLKQPGTYSLDLLHNEEILGSWRILAKQEDNPQKR